MQTRLYVVLLFLAITGCTSQPLQSGRESVLLQAQKRTINDQTVAQLNCSDKPVNLSMAMQLALQCNPNIQIALAELDINAAALNQQVRINNPRLALSLRDNSQASNFNIELDLITPVLDLILYPAKKSAARATLDSRQQQVLATILTLTNNVEQA